MSWFKSGVSTVELDNKISEATSESIPNGDVELSVALEITDLIRSKKIPPQQCMRSLKKRLTLVYSNPNLLTSTLKLIDLCVKNSGYHFLIEISSKEFIDYLIGFIFKVHYNVNQSISQTSLDVGNFILSLLQEWKLAFEGQLQLNYVEKTYNSLKSSYKFPPIQFKPSSTFIDLEVPPDWIDSDGCMICYNPFLMLNRKHHCRSCGGVFCNDHSLSRIPLVSLGIMDPVRVCDNCDAKHNKNSNKVKGNSRNGRGRSNTESSNNSVESGDEDLKKAIELSLKESAPQAAFTPTPAPVATQDEPDEEEDEEMKAAIAASLKAFEQQNQIQQSYQEPASLQPSQPESDFYNIPLPEDSWQQPQNNNWQQQSQPQFSQQQQFSQPSQPSQPPRKPPVEDLTQQDEENINLFMTLMTTLKNDPKKRSEILYDDKLNNLHSKVVTLKPKVNRSLRVSIEKYEAFLELNNKISTVTKLYDDFLESKLNLAYKNHNLNNNFYNQDQNYGQLPPQHSGYQPDINYQQSEPYSNVHYSQGQGSFQENNRRNSDQEKHSYPPQPSFPPENETMSYPEEPSFPSPSFQNAPSKSESNYGPPPTTFNNQKQSQPQFIAEDSPDIQDDSDREYLRNISQSQSAGPSAPFEYPEIEDKSNLNTDSLAPSGPTRRMSSTIPNYALEEANAKYPALEEEIDVESDAAPNASGYSNMDRFPQIPTNDLQPLKSGGSKYVAEPEALIEL